MTLNDLALVVMCQTNTYPRAQEMWPYEGLSNHWFPLMLYETLVDDGFNFQQNGSTWPN